MEHLKLDLVAIGREIKQRFRSEIGEVISCNVGIAPNRFLAKLAASLHKPDGLDLINHENLVDIYRSLKLTDLNGINTKFQARLHPEKIFTPLDFLQAPLDLLQNRVFKSINGYYWFMRLRGYEIDDIEYARHSYGQMYALGKKTSDPQELSRLLMKLCEKMGRRLRRDGQTAQGIHIGIIYADGTYWHRGRMVNTPVYGTDEIFIKATWVFNQQPEPKVVSHLAVSCYGLDDSPLSQSSLFEAENKKGKSLSHWIK